MSGIMDEKDKETFSFLNHWKSNLLFLYPSLTSSIFPCSEDAFHTVTLLLDNPFPTPFEKVSSTLIKQFLVLTFPYFSTLTV